VNGTTAGLRRKGFSPRVQRYVPWLAALVLLAGVIAAIVRFAPDRNPAPSVIPKTPPKAVPKEKSVHLSKAAAKVAYRFILTAVARTDLAAAWKISGPNVRGNLTYKEWLRGNIPVVPFPVDTRHFAPHIKIDYSYKNDAQLQLLLQPKVGSGMRPQLFIIELKRVASADGKARWIVNNWVPRTVLAIPKTGN
jgi:hypothetical protein